MLAAHKWDSLDMHGCRGVRVGLRTLVSSSIEQGAVVSCRRGACQTSKTDLQTSASLRWWGIDEDFTRKWGLSRLGKGLPVYSIGIVELGLAISDLSRGCGVPTKWRLEARLYCTPRVFYNAGCEIRYV